VKLINLIKPYFALLVFLSANHIAIRHPQMENAPDPKRRRKTSHGGGGGAATVLNDAAMYPAIGFSDHSKPAPVPWDWSLKSGGVAASKWRNQVHCT
jgi:hypothetical protein